MNKKTIIIILAAMIVLFVAIIYSFKEPQEPIIEKGEVLLPKASPGQSKSLIAEASYSCDDGKTVKASFYKGETIEVKPGDPPVPTGSAKIVLSDGRNFDLAQTISADGGRYANADESFVFWIKGDGAIVLENGAEKDYTRCVVPSKQ